MTLLEADEVGGTSLNRGPAPVRTLARAARLAREWSSWAEFGLDGPPPVPNLPAILASSARIARYARDRKQMAAHPRQNGVDLAEHLGPVRFTSPDTLRAGDGRSRTADRIILAVAGHAAKLPVPGGDLALSYEDLPSLTALPRTAAIVGGADTGCQIASIAAGNAISGATRRVACNVIPAHVLGEYSAEVVQVVAAPMAGAMTVEQVGALQFAFPTFTEAIGMAAQKICREIGAGLFPLVCSELVPEVIEEEPS